MSQASGENSDTGQTSYPRWLHHRGFTRRYYIVTIEDIGRLSILFSNPDMKRCLLALLVTGTIPLLLLGVAFLYPQDANSVNSIHYANFVEH